MSVVVTLVHGTWGRKSAWTKEPSRLVEHLRTNITDQVVVRRFEWSGRNTPRARSQAAQELKATLYAGIAEYPEGEHFVIAHSHGGNVALYAFNDNDLLERMCGLVCLATPFLTARNRDLGPFAEESMGLLTLFAGFALALWVTWSSHKPSTTVLYVSFVGFFLGFALLLKYWEELSKGIVDRFTIPSVPARSLLIVRMSADEAASALSAAQFLGWFFSRLWLLLSNLAARLRQWIEGFPEPGWQQTLTRGTLVVGMVGGLLFGLASLITYVFNHTSLEPAVEITGTVFLAASFCVVSYVLMFSVAYLSQLLALFLLVLIVLPISIAIMPFGPELVLTSLFVEITIEPIPAGTSYEVHSFISHTDGSLSHTQSYDDDRVLNLIVDWMNRTRDSRASAC